MDYSLSIYFEIWHKPKRTEYETILVSIWEKKIRIIERIFVWLEITAVETNDDDRAY